MQFVIYIYDTCQRQQTTFCFIKCQKRPDNLGGAASQLQMFLIWDFIKGWNEFAAVLGSLPIYSLKLHLNWLNKDFIDPVGQNVLLL